MHRQPSIHGHTRPLGPARGVSPLAGPARAVTVATARSLIPKAIGTRLGQPAAFTLLEMMAVMLLLAILAALLLPAVTGASNTARRGMTLTLFSTLQQSLAAFKDRFGVYPPSSIRLREDGAYASGNVVDRESKRWLKKMWPKMVLGGESGFVGWDFNDDGDTSDVFDLDGFKCLLFFLAGMPEIEATAVLPGTGFDTDPLNPFKRTSTLRDGPYLANLKASDLRKQEVDASASVVAKDTADAFYEIADPIGNDRSLAYFSSYGGRGYRPSDCTFTGEPAVEFRINGNLTGTVDGPNPYCKNNPGNNSGGKSDVFWNATGFQIISAGFDGRFGRGGRCSEGGRNLGQYDRDNLTNFCKTELGTWVLESN